jgi:hypothetical protein
MIDKILDALFGAVSRFSRKRPPEKNKGFDRPHFASLDGLCIYCGKRPDGRQCQGP